MKDDLRKDIVIKCPSCDCEYLPGEIYIPNRLIGQPKEVERTVEGRIWMYDGIEPDMEETFICEKCGKPFKIKAKLSFDTEYNSKYDFSEEFSTPIYGNDRLHLEEE